MKPADMSTALGMAVPSVYRYMNGTRSIPMPTELAIGNIERLRALGERPAEKYKPMAAFATPDGKLPRLRMDQPDQPDRDDAVRQALGALLIEGDTRKAVDILVKALPEKL